MREELRRFGDGLSAGWFRRKLLVTMAWIRMIDNDDAEGLLAKLYEAALKRSGRVFNILRLQSVNPSVLQAGIGQYMAVMHKDSPLSRAQREMLATVVSRANECHY